MKKAVALLLIVMMSCKTYDITYDTRPKTEGATKEQTEKDEDKYILYIVLERSLKGHHVEIEAPAPHQFNPVDERVPYYEGVLSFTDGSPATSLSVNAAGEICINLNKTKIVIPAGNVAYKYLYISSYKKKYLLEYSHNKKQYYD